MSIRAAARGEAGGAGGPPWAWAQTALMADGAIIINKEAAHKRHKGEPKSTKEDLFPAFLCRFVILIVPFAVRSRFVCLVPFRGHQSLIPLRDKNADHAVLPGGDEQLAVAASADVQVRTRDFCAHGLIDELLQRNGHALAAFVAHEALDFFDRCYG